MILLSLGFLHFNVNTFYSYRGAVAIVAELLRAIERPPVLNFKKKNARMERGQTRSWVSLSVLY